jgi:hypothetical protein
VVLGVTVGVRASLGWVIAGWPTGANGHLVYA